jgi:aspartyl-tRNA(Asn)/glutamyl-tRNA(Gln) amidotransferase subunit B
VSDKGALETAVTDVIARFPAQVAGVHGAARTACSASLVGQVMKATGGKANPQVVQDILRAALQS